MLLPQESKFWPSVTKNTFYYYSQCTLRVTLNITRSLFAVFFLLIRVCLEYFKRKVKTNNSSPLKGHCLAEKHKLIR